jgi:2-keto-3-deoxy-L-rhamnonate aldolase RhmA
LFYEIEMKNLLKEKLMNGEAPLGTFIELGHPDITEILSHLGFDWLLLDGEHSPNGFETMERMLQAMSDTDCTPIIRPQWNDPVIIKRVLDIGAHGVLVPWVNTKDEALAAVKACRYPPEGIRGWGPRRASRWDPDYRETANQEILVTIQVETQKSLDNLDEIMGVEGVDACYVGPWDLSNNLGYSVPPKYSEPGFIKALDRVLKVAEDHGKPAGLFCNMDNIKWAIDKGFRYNTVASADDLLIYGAKKAIEAAKS